MARETVPKFPRMSYQQLEQEYHHMKDENASLKKEVARLTEEMRGAREEWEREKAQQQEAAEQLYEALREFCQQPQPQVPVHNVLTTPRLGVESRASTESTSWADLENKVYAMSARVHNKHLSSPQKSQLNSLEDHKSPGRRSSMSALRRSRLSLGGRRDPVGGFGEVVAQIARDRANRQQKLGNQENISAQAEQSLTPPTISQADRTSSLTSSFRRCSFGRSPCSSLNTQAHTSTPPAPGMVCMHTNMLADMSGDKSASPCVDSAGNSTVQSGLARPLDRDPLLDIAPTPAGPEDSFNFAEKVLSDITPSAQPDGLAGLLASVVQQAKSKAKRTIAEEAEQYDCSEM